MTDRFKVKVTEDAKLDVRDAVDWYEFQRPGLGIRFKNHLNQAISQLKLNPYRQIRFDSVRVVPMKIFPYTIHYELVEDKKLVVIISVFHNARSPKRWRNT